MPLKSHNHSPPTQFRIQSSKQHLASRFWMRAVSFVSLRKLVQLVAQYPDGLLAKDIDELVKEQRVFTVRNGKVPSPTTIYHYRNTLLHFGILVRKNRRLHLNYQSQEILDLLSILSNEPDLSPTEKEHFAKLVVRQIDCREFFFDIFWSGQDIEYDLQTWLRNATPVIWKEVDETTQREVHLRQFEDHKLLSLYTENHIQAVLYGVRYWVRDELGIIDEIFLEDVGNIMFPILSDDKISSERIVQLILSHLDAEHEWTHISLRDLAFSICVKYRVSLKYLFETIRLLYRKYPGHITLIPTSRSFATLTTSSKFREKYELRNYLRDERGVYISHVRFHRYLKRFDNLSSPEEKEL